MEVRAVGEGGGGESGCGGGGGESGDGGDVEREVTINTDRDDRLSVDRRGRNTRAVVAQQHLAYVD